MIDREKVIKGLEGIYRCISPVTHTCGDCPYQDNHVECIRRALSDALAILKEQKAKKPIYNLKKYRDYLPHCPSCEKVLPNVSQYGRAKFCHNCGQAVKWND